MSSPHNFPAYTARGLQVAAIVADRREKIRRYIEETGLPFDILIDETQDMIRAYGVWHRFGFDAWNIARPAVFLIDPDGTIRDPGSARIRRSFPRRRRYWRRNRMRMTNAIASIRIRHSHCSRLSGSAC